MRVLGGGSTKGAIKDLHLASWLPGPGDLPGMRLAAERTAHYVTAAARGYGLPKQPPWEAAAAVLGAERGRVDTDLPLEGHGPLPPLPAPRVHPNRHLGSST